eukprot:TRINITY_DN1874_c0_g2_i1.p1 TRINITY_DN1874_c0_g2~~TRINITY_DN1874_c0_g2_i1.p1  ORF type:complete len:383 (+),score=102.18 TRINITY_DN1874_c0_g2_i1:87-1235(+)
MDNKIPEERVNDSDVDIATRFTNDLIDISNRTAKWVQQAESIEQNRATLMLRNGTLQLEAATNTNVSSVQSKDDASKIEAYFGNAKTNSGELKRLSDHIQEGIELIKKIKLREAVETITNAMDSPIWTRSELGDDLRKDSHQLQYQETLSKHTQEERLSECRSKLKELEPTLQECNEEVSDLKKKLAAAENKTAKVKKEIEACKADIKNIENQFEEEIKEIQAAREQNLKEQKNNNNHIEKLVQIKNDCIATVNQLDNSVRRFTDTTFTDQYNILKACLQQYNDDIKEAEGAAESIIDLVDKATGGQYEHYSEDTSEGNICGYYVRTVNEIQSSKSQLPTFNAPDCQAVTKPSPLDSSNSSTLNQTINFGEPLQDELPILRR